MCVQTVMKRTAQIRFRDVENLRGSYSFQPTPISLSLFKLRFTRLSQMTTITICNSLGLIGVFTIAYLWEDSTNVGSSDVLFFIESDRKPRTTGRSTRTLFCCSVPQTTWTSSSGGNSNCTKEGIY